MGCRAVGTLHALSTVRHFSAMTPASDYMSYICYDCQMGLFGGRDGGWYTLLM